MRVFTTHRRQRVHAVRRQFVLWFGALTVCGLERGHRKGGLACGRNLRLVTCRACLRAMRRTPCESP